MPGCGSTWTRTPTERWPLQRSDHLRGKEGDTGPPISTAGGAGDTLDQKSFRFHLPFVEGLNKPNHP
jgi:hypothetical protein